MAQYDDSEFLTPSPEEIKAEEQKEEVRRMVRAEYRRIQSGEADEDIKKDIETEEAKKAEQKKLPGWLLVLRSVLSGDILNSEKASRAYNMMSYIAFLFFLNIICILWSFSTGHQRDQLEDETTLLRDQAIRSKETMYQKTSHSAIVEEIEKRKLGLHDPAAPSDVIN